MDCRKQWITRLHKAQVGHYTSSEKLYKIANWNGAILIVCTISLTLLTFYDVDDLNIPVFNDVYKIILAILGAVSACLSSYQTMYRPNERAEIHRSQAAAYGSLKRKLELEGCTSKDRLEEVLKEVENKWEVIASNSPLTKKKIIEELENDGMFACPGQENKGTDDDSSSKS